MQTRPIQQAHDEVKFYEKTSLNVRIRLVEDTPLATR